MSSNSCITSSPTDPYGLTQFLHYFQLARETQSTVRRFEFVDEICVSPRPLVYLILDTDAARTMLPLQSPLPEHVTLVTCLAGMTYKRTQELIKKLIPQVADDQMLTAAASFSDGVLMALLLGALSAKDTKEQFYICVSNKPQAALALRGLLMVAPDRWCLVKPAKKEVHIHQAYANYSEPFKGVHQLLQWLADHRVDKFPLLQHATPPAHPKRIE